MDKYYAPILSFWDNTFDNFLEKKQIAYIFHVYNCVVFMDVAK